MMAGKANHFGATLHDTMTESIGIGIAPRLLHTPLSTASDADAKRQGVSRPKDAALIELDRIVRDENQPREEFDPESLERLAESLRTRGQLQPIRVRWDGGRGVYVVLCGERRYRAARMAGMTTIACVIHEGDIDVLAVQLIENALREDLKPIEQARAFKALIDSKGWEYQRLASELAVDPSVITRALALLDLPTAVQSLVEQGSLAPSTAYEVSKLVNPRDQATAAELIVTEDLSKAESVELVKAIKAKRPSPARRPEPVAIELGNCTVTLRWKKAEDVDVLAILKRAATAWKAKQHPPG